MSVVSLHTNLTPPATFHRIQSKGGNKSSFNSFKRSATLCNNLGYICELTTIHCVTCTFDSCNSSYIKSYPASTHHLSGVISLMERFIYE